jgi:competence protein ComEC
MKASSLRRGLVATLIVLVLAGAATAQTLRIYNVDVEQADATLLVMPNGKTLLIDSGKNGHGRRIKAVMDKAGVTHIDAFVASHYHEDHYGGIDDLVDMGVPVLASYDRGDKGFLPDTTTNQKTFKDYMRAVGEDARPLRRGTTIVLDPLVTITCIGSGGVVIGETRPIPADEENDLSVSLVVSFAGFRAYFGGDTEASTEAKLVEHGLARDIDFYKASHHGSHSSSSLTFMEDMKPSLIVVSNGSAAAYKHPRQSTLNAYAALPGPPLVLQTNKCLVPSPCGNVADTFISDPQTTDQDGTVVTTVEAPTHSFTVSWATSVRTFPIRAAAGPAPDSSQVVLESMTPNPVGDDEANETVTLRNKGAGSVSLSGWHLRDRSGSIWALSGTLGPAQSRTFRRNGQAMSLNNAADEIALLDSGQVQRDRFTYAAATEGLAIATGH